MEVRLIDSSSNQPHHAGKVVGSPLKTISSNNRTTHKFSESHDHPAPFQYLIRRALTRAGKVEGVAYKLDDIEGTRGPLSESRVLLNAPAPDSLKCKHLIEYGVDSGGQPYLDCELGDWECSKMCLGYESAVPDSQDDQNAGRTRTDSRGSTLLIDCQSAPSSPAPFSYLRLKTLESPHHAGTTEQEDGNAGNQTFVRECIHIPSDKMAPTFYFGCPAPSQRAGKADCASINVVGTRVHAAIIDGGRAMDSCHSAPDSQAYRPSSGPHSIPEYQNADGTARSHILLSSSRVSPVQNGSARTLPRRPSAPNSTDQNAGHSDGHSPPRLIGLKPKLLSRSPCASHSSNSTEVIGRDAKTLSPFKRFFSYLWSIRLERLKTREMTNFGWRKKT